MQQEPGPPPFRGALQAPPADLLCAAVPVVEAQHLTKVCDVTLSQKYMWDILRTLMTEVLPKKDWLCVFDHVFSNEPVFLVYVVVAYMLVR